MSKNKLNNLPIKSWAKEDRPREKLLKSGEHTLSDTELIAILLRSGTYGKSAIDLARQILLKFKTFKNMGHTDLRDWKEIKGLGTAKITQLKAAIEIARRFDHQAEVTHKFSIKNTEEVVKQYKTRMRYLKNEIFKIILCDAKNRNLEEVDLAQGTPTESYPIIREIISTALQKFASSIICIHNHPFGDPTPSTEDENFTSKLKEASSFMGIKLLDHIIFGENAYYSFDKRIAERY